MTTVNENLSEMRSAIQRGSSEDLTRALARVDLDRWRDVYAPYLKSFGSQLPILLFGREHGCNFGIEHSKRYPGVNFGYQCPWTNAEYWCLSGQYHREEGLPAYDAVWVYTKRAWCHQGKFHREGDLPARIQGESSWWYQHGNLHRDHDLPAVMLADGTKLWYRHGKSYSPTNG